MVFSHCRDCNQQLNASRYETKAEVIRTRRIVIWQYIAPRCAICSFNAHHSAMDMHHLGQKEGHIAELITRITLTLDVRHIEVLLREAAKCIPLCSNCHRMVHAQAIKPPANLSPPTYSLADLLTRLKST